MRVVVLGPPGSGKGTQARLVASTLGVAHVSVGDALRAEVAGGSPLGARVAATVAAGDLVAMADVLAVLQGPLRGATRAGGWVLDGAPRTVAQAQDLERVLIVMDAAVQLVISLEVPDHVVRSRLIRRARLERRVDDTAEVIDHRLAVWARDGVPVLAWYEQQGLLAGVDGTGDVATIALRVVAAVETLRQVS